MRYYKDSVGVISISLGQLILNCETNVLLIRTMCTCGFYPTLSVTGSHTDSFSVYVFRMKKKHESRTLMSLSFVDLSDDIQLSAPR